MKKMSPEVNRLVNELVAQLHKEGHDIDGRSHGVNIPISFDVSVYGASKKYIHVHSICNDLDLEGNYEGVILDDPRKLDVANGL